MSTSSLAWFRFRVWPWRIHFNAGRWSVVAACVLLFSVLFVSLRNQALPPMSTLELTWFSEQTDSEDAEGAWRKMDLQSADGDVRQGHAIKPWMADGVVWMRFEVPEALGLSRVILKAGSIKQLDCFSRSQPEMVLNDFKRVGPYFLGPLNTGEFAGSWLCRLRLIGIDEISVQLHYEERFLKWAADFNQKNHFVQGAMLALAIVSVLMSFMIRSRQLATLAVWMLLGLHFLAMASGWEQDLLLRQWWALNPQTWYELNWVVYLWTLAAYLLLLECRSGCSAQGRAAVWSSGVSAVAVTVAALLDLDYSLFLAILWVVLTPNVCVIAVRLLNAYRPGASTRRIYHGLALFTLLVLGVAEMASPWLNMSHSLDVIGGRAFALSAAVLLMLTVSDSLARNKKEKQGLLSSLQTLYREQEAMIQLLPEAVFVLDHQGQLLKANPVFDKLNASLIRQQKRSPLLQRIQQALATDQMRGDHTSEHHFALADEQGNLKHFEMRLSPSPSGSIGVLRDITARHVRGMAQFQQIVHDEVSGALNRQGLEHLIAERCQQGLQQCTAIVLELHATSTDAQPDRDTLRAFARFVKSAAKFSGDLVHLEAGRFLFLAKPQKDLSAIQFFQEARLWAQVDLPVMRQRPWQVLVMSRVVSLESGVTAALHQLLSASEPSQSLVFELGRQEPVSGLSLDVQRLFPAEATRTRPIY